MFGKIFGRRRPKLDQIIIPETCLEADAEEWATTEALVNFVNSMREQALFVDEELPQDAVSLYYADYYYAQVCNGGHSQFVHNANDPVAVLMHAIKAFRAMQAGTMARTAQDLIAWIEANPEQAEKQDGFENRHPDLDALDDSFYRADQGNTYFNLAFDYITRLPNLQVVRSSSYAQAIENTRALNPKYEQRQQKATIGRITGSARDPLRAGTQMAACSASLDMEITSINAGRPITIDEEDTFLWGLTTNKGFLWGGVYSGGSFVAPNDNGNPDTPIGRLGPDELSANLEHAKRHEVGAIVVELCKKAKVSENISFAICVAPPEGVNVEQDAAIYLLKTEQGLFRAVISKDKCHLLELEAPKQLATVKASNVDKMLQKLGSL